jgi:hypothetical protein
MTGHGSQQSHMMCHIGDDNTLTVLNLTGGAVAVVCCWSVLELCTYHGHVDGHCVPLLDALRLEPVGLQDSSNNVTRDPSG